MTHEERGPGRRIEHRATEEERTRHAKIRQLVEAERPELAAWARAVAGHGAERVAVGTVFAADEQPVLDAIDAYAAGHALPGRAAVVREALSRLLGLDIAAEPPRGDPGPQLPP